MSFISRVLSSGPAIEIRLNSGKTLRGSIHPSFNAQPALLGRAVDLSKAYKQAALHPASKKHSVLGVRKKMGDWAFFVSRSIPFGASASVSPSTRPPRLCGRRWCGRLGCWSVSSSTISQSSSLSHSKDRHPSCYIRSSIVWDGCMLPQARRRRISVKP